MELTICIANHWAEEFDDPAEAIEMVLRGYRDSLRDLDPHTRLIRARGNFVNFGRPSPPTAMKEFVIDVEDSLATWLVELAEFIDSDSTYRDDIVRGIVRAALGLYRRNRGEWSGFWEAKGRGERGCG